ncbi:hypothetical protein ZWY2020_034957 [Hordeum vulgare]|nr:hypothetical protein ZWY2020_034957 [Hordeum vulgare]
MAVAADPEPEATATEVGPSGRARPISSSPAALTVAVAAVDRRPNVNQRPIPAPRFGAARRRHVGPASKPTRATSPAPADSSPAGCCPGPSQHRIDCLLAARPRATNARKELA